MTKRELIARVAEDCGALQQEARRILQGVLVRMAEAVSRGERVELRKFGVFETRVQGLRIGRNPKAPGKPVVIPPRYVVKFKPAAEVRKALLKLVPPPTARVGEPGEAKKGAAPGSNALGTGARLAPKRAARSKRREQGPGNGKQSSEPGGLEASAAASPGEPVMQKPAASPRPKPSAGSK